jgi:hypothetical protein
MSIVPSKPEKPIAICEDFLQNNCTLQDSCPNLHTNQPYQWQYTSASGSWISFPDDINQQIHQMYLDPHQGAYYFSNRRCVGVFLSELTN